MTPLPARCRVGAGGLAVLLGAAATGLSPGAAESARATPAAPTFAVGARLETFVDATRPTPANGSFAGSPTRTLPTLVLYPAVGPAGPTDRTGAAPAGRALPLIVFSHGSNSDGPTYEPLLRQWAEAGFVVAAPTFPLSRHGAPGGDTVADYPHQPGDVSFVITSMLRLSRDPRARFRNVIDARRVGVVGHSLGAITTLGVAVNSCCADARIRAAVSIEGIELPFGSGTFFRGPAVPLLLFHGDADQTIPYSASQRLFADAPSPKYFVTLHGAPHTPFRQTDTATRPAPSWEPVVVTSVVDFLHRYLRGQPAGLTRLRVDATVPGVASIQVG
ncbi:MAG TPA: phospholipase [Acidimicrobiia bacterium]|nr:phospholipase [Acidimicrobiia bacterium]